MARFDDELEQISLKQSIGKRKNTNRQHANREDIIKMTISRENEEFSTCGLGKKAKQVVVYLHQFLEIIMFFFLPVVVQVLQMLIIHF